MPFTIDVDLIENNEVQITENASGILEITHSPSGTTLTVDDSVAISNIGIDTEDDGATVVAEATSINFGENLSVTDDGDGTVTVDSGAKSSVELTDADGDGNNWVLTEDGANGHLNFNSSGGGGTQMDLEHNGNLHIEGELTENSSL